jgi:hypothetical protein
MNLLIFLTDLIKADLQMPNLLALVECLTTPFKNQLNQLTTVQNSNTEKLKYNGQIVILEARLHQLYSNDLDHPIYISDAYKPILYMYLEKPTFCQTKAIQQDEWSPTIYVTAIFISTEKFYLDSGVDFEVNLSGATPNITQLKQTINFYKLASKRYKINP